jgi:subtilisin-like proprotein convertase family protein
MNFATTTIKLSATIVTLSMLAGAAANAGLYTYDQTVNAAIPDANPNGMYSTITVSGLTGLTVADVNVVLNVSGTCNGDLYAYLSHGNSGSAVLLNRVGRTSANPFGYGDLGFSITLDDQASRDIHSSSSIGSVVTGTYQPDARNVDPLVAFDTSARTAMLDSLNHANPNGAWTLFFADAASGEQSTLNGWSLQITAVPEPINQAMMVFGVLFFAGLLWRHRRWNGLRLWSRLGLLCKAAEFNLLRETPSPLHRPPEIPRPRSARHAASCLESPGKRRCAPAS